MEYNRAVGRLQSRNAKGGPALGLVARPNFPLKLVAVLQTFCARLSRAVRGSNPQPTD